MSNNNNMRGLLRFTKYRILSNSIEMPVKTNKFRQFSSTRSSSSTVDESEINHFKTFTSEWWDENGPTRALHSFNTIRVPLIRDGLFNTGAIEKANAQPLKSLKILDIGCGGGILAEPLARLGGEITGLDANDDVIVQAKRHADNQNLKINYVSTSIEEHVKTTEATYDVIVASEIFEHITNKKDFLNATVKCLKPEGSIFITTINQTNWANFAAIFLGENVFRWLPKGTHEYQKLIAPHRLQRMLEDENCKTLLVHGMVYNPLTNNWHFCSNTSINYGLHALKRPNQ